ncbi:type II/IV secretion system-related protein [Desulfuromonas versatilis]|uniref:Type II/IV secretion system-related protein n=1 Tax=Desulfuromonas versatilis TaxID=2802975 RepID=A0ABM8HPA6_9BACT|nr:CpaF family protein [Desulfuromonas versatilis]BCR03455.1 type II/IV secretion system-related protein [Desulfuromonas versatilis]
MALRGMFKTKKNLPDPPAAPLQFTGAGRSANERDENYYLLKHKIHSRLVEELNLKALDTFDAEEVRPEIGRVIEDFLLEEKALLNEEEIRELINETMDELKGLGPIEPFLKDPTVSDILCNAYNNIYVERYGLLEKTRARFLNNAHMMNIIDRIVSRVGRRVDESTPMVDARLADGSRVNAIIPPLAIDGPILSIRRFAVNPLTMDDLIRHHTLPPHMARFLGGCVKAKLNIMISGGTGAGKTTLLNVLSGYIPDQERIVTIEDAAELQLQQQHVVRLETRPANIEGTGLVTQRELVRNSLRMRPDRIIIGEVRGPETFDMLQAMNTGHDGSLTTVHANSPRDSLTRLESMILMTGINLPEKAMRFMISSALDMIIQVTRLADGTRKITSICEVSGMEGEIITLQDVFLHEKKGLSPDGKVLGRFRASGIRPRFAEKLEMAGIEVSPETFSPDRYYE